MESVFILLSAQKQQAQLLGVRAMIQAMMPNTEAEQKPVIQAFMTYYDTTFPYLEKAKDLDYREEKEQLLRFVEKPARIDLRPVWQAQAHHRQRTRMMSRRFKLKGLSGGRGFGG